MQVEITYDGASSGMATLHTPKYVEPEELKALEERFSGSRMKFAGNWKKVDVTDSKAERRCYTQTIYGNPENGYFYTSWAGAGIDDLGDPRYGSSQYTSMIQIWMKAWQILKGGPSNSEQAVRLMLLPVDPEEYEEDPMAPEYFQMLATDSTPVEENSNWRKFDPAVRSNPIRYLTIFGMVTVARRMYSSEFVGDRFEPKDAWVQKGMFDGKPTLTAIEFLSSEITLW